MYHSGKNPLRRVTRDSENVAVAKGLRQRRLHKAFLRYHDPNNWPVIREALRRMGKGRLIGSGPNQLIPAYQPPGTGDAGEGRRRAGAPPPRGAARQPIRTQHTGLPKVPARLPARAPAAPATPARGARRGAKPGPRSGR